MSVTSGSSEVLVPRVTMLKNSANPGVHVNEILVYADGAAPSEGGQ